MPVFFITAAQIHNGTVTIAGPLLDHLRSLRVHVGEELRVGDDQHRRYRMTITRIGRHELIGRITEEEHAPARRSPPLVLAPALLKGDRMDWLVQKATELGVSSIVPLITRYSVVRPQVTRIPHQRLRWERIALEAAQQSERWDIPTLENPCDFAEFVPRQSDTRSGLILTERASGYSLLAVPLPEDATRPIVLVVGPEGGWTAEELGLARACGFSFVTLGNRVLRAETAALAGLSILQSRLGELG